MALGWGTRRQLLYYAVVIVIAAIVVFIGYQSFFTSAPTCFDGAQNGTETGVDCGGSCSLLCAAQTRGAVVLWARAFPVAPRTYTAAAYVQNSNGLAAARSVSYSFQLFDDKNLLIVERDGVINLPPIPTIPIVEPNINVGERTVARTLFSFSTTAVWKKVPPGSIPAVSVGNQQLNADASSLSATVTNNSLQDAPGVTVAAVLFDVAGVARAASKSTIDLAAHSSQPIVFTWQGGVSNIVRAEITVVPPF